MSLKSGKIVLIWTLSLFLVSLCLGWLPLFSLVQKYFLNTGTDMVFGGKTYSSDTDAEPIVVLRGNRHISDYVDLKLRFRVKEFSEYANAFQTAPGNEGLRLELSSTPQGTIQSGVVYL